MSIFKAGEWRASPAAYDYIHRVTAQDVTLGDGQCLDFVAAVRECVVTPRVPPVGAVESGYVTLRLAPPADARHYPHDREMLCTAGYTIYAGKFTVHCQRVTATYAHKCVLDSRLVPDLWARHGGDKYGELVYYSE